MQLVKLITETKQHRKMLFETTGEIKKNNRYTDVIPCKLKFNQILITEL